MQLNLIIKYQEKCINLDSWNSFYYLQWLKFENRNSIRNWTFLNLDLVTQLVWYIHGTYSCVSIKAEKIETIYMHNSLHLLSLGIQISIAYVLWLFGQTPYGRGFLKCFRKAQVRADFASFVKESTLLFLIPISS